MARLLTKALTSFFTSSTRARAFEYVSSGRVRLLTSSGDDVSATVRGTVPYRVDISVSEEAGATLVGVSCECPYYRDNGEPCKHIWATLLAAERDGRLPPAAGAVQLELQHDIATGDETADEFGLTPPPVTPSPADRRASTRRLGPGEQIVAALEAHVQGLHNTPAPVFRYADGELMYVFVPAPPQSDAAMQVVVLARNRKKNGEWTKPKNVKLTRADLVAAPDVDRAILGRLFGGVHQPTAFGFQYLSTVPTDAIFGLTQAIVLDLVPAIAATGRAFLQVTRPSVGRPDPYAPYAAPVVDYIPMRWDDGPPWRLTPVVTASNTGGWRLEGKLTRAGGEWLGLGDLIALSHGFVWTRSAVARAEVGPAVPLLVALAAGGAIEIPGETAPRLAAALAELGLPSDDLPEPFQVERIDIAPSPRLSVTPDSRRSDVVLGEISFAYGESIVPASAASTHFDAATRRLIARRPDVEVAALNRLRTAGFRPRWDAYGRTSRLELPARDLPDAVASLIADGWHVEAQGGVYRSPGAVRLSVVSHVDWFDLHATVDFGETTAALTDVLAALERKQPTVRLGDGTIGILPEQWLDRYLPLAAAGEMSDGRIRFRHPQVALLDALLEEATAAAVIDVDEGFRHARDELAALGTLAPVDPPPGFTGVLREYQREGLGWLQFLERARFGGCLADDMGLGKTVMVLALLAGRRNGPADDHRPSLVVVPRSLVHNWMSEAARFAPDLRLMDFSTATRHKGAPDFSGVDVVFATYGTIRRDVLRLKDVEFDYVIIDEAQAIKNEHTASAKAVRLLYGRHRLALTGTPIENHLGELWSLFEFLNPGILGRSAIFRRAASAVPDADAIALLARGLRPFLLRRTKQQVARELPAKTEQTITCELSKPERALYDGLRKHYRASVLARVERDGIKRSQMHILEALLRLRQAACHPALVDRTRAYPSSAKLDVVLAQTKEVIAEGHKAIVFSQFTTLLGLLRQHLNRDGVAYEYLDGKTTRRAEHVQRFQEDPACKLFLVSLKAGGVGLNLTAAEYVFLLDPWWNPAVESQAIDRAHRIGQTREVFAYRIVAGNTIESKILELQASKRALADAVLGGGSGGLKSLAREDLELLLS